MILSYNSGVGQKPSILDVIIKQGVSSTPILEMLGSKSISSYKHAWISDRYRDPSANSNLEVSGLGATPISTKQKTENVCQIIKNEFGVSQRQMELSMYGEDELPYQRKKVGVEHTKDIEYAILGLNNATVFDGFVEMTATVPAKMAGIFHFIPVAHRKNFEDSGNPTDFTYTKLCEIIEPVWRLGGLDDERFNVIVSSALKAKINSWLETSPSMRVNVPDNKYDPRVTTIATDFGNVDIIMHRLFSDPKLNDKVLVGSFSEAKLAFLTKTKLMDVKTDKTAIYERYYTDLTLEVTNSDYFACGQGLK